MNENKEINVAENTQESVEIVGVRFKEAGKIYYFDPCKLTIDCKGT